VSVTNANKAITLALSCAILAIALVVHAAIGIRSFINSPGKRDDFNRYYEIASTPGRPYVDYQVEHPIGTLLVFKLLAGLGGRAAFGYVVVALNALGDALIVAALIRGWGVQAAACYAVILVPVLGLFFNRVDAWPTAAATLAVASWRRGRPGGSGAALAVGSAFKLWPLVLTPLTLQGGRRSQAGAFGPARTQVDRRIPVALTPLVAFAVVAGVLAGAAAWLAGANSLMQVVTFRGAQGWQIESVVGSLIHLRGSETVRLESGAWRIGTTTGAVSIAMFLAAAPMCLWSSWRGFRTNRPGSGWLAAVASLLLLSALLSAQYVIWLTPGVGIAWAEGDRRSVGIAALAVLLTMVYWTYYDLVIAGAPAALLVVVRNVVLALLLVSALLGLRGRGVS
jgi:hypothetical protein